VQAVREWISIFRIFKQENNSMQTSSTALQLQLIFFNWLYFTNTKAEFFYNSRGVSAKISALSMESARAKDF
jgi:hypothetical protein